MSSLPQGDGQVGLLVGDLVDAVVGRPADSDEAAAPARDLFLERIERVMPRVATLARAVRAHGGPVIWSKPLVRTPGDDRFVPAGSRPATPHVVSPCRPGTPGWRTPATLDPQPSDYEIGKRSSSSFWGANADAILRNRGVTDLFVAGCLTNVGVIVDAIDAVMRGYRVWVASDACAALTDAEHAEGLELYDEFRIVETTWLVDTLGSAR